MGLDTPRGDDRSPVRGEFILTGSVTPNDDTRRHSAAGRISTLRMRPDEPIRNQPSTGSVSLRGLFAGATPRAIDPGVTISEMV